MLKFKPTYPAGKGSEPALTVCCLTGSPDALEAEEDSLGFVASAAVLFVVLGWAQSVVVEASSPADITDSVEVWLSEQLAASSVDWGSAVVLVQSVDMGASEPTIASETEELPVSGTEEDVSPLTEKWEIRKFAYQSPKS